VDNTQAGIDSIRLRENERWTFGYCEYKAAQITVAPDADELQQRVSLLHEVFHAILSHLGINPFNNEDVVTPVAGELLDVLRRNPKMVDYLMDGARTECVDYAAEIARQAEADVEANRHYKYHAPADNNGAWRSDGGPQ
jgi:hypothetical protein